MSGTQIHNVRFEPLGVEMEIEEGETVLNAAFRQGVSLMHGCKEGQCGSCKSRLVDGDIELLKYSTFALPDYESETGHVLLCRTHVFSDASFELLNYDEDLLSRSIAVKEFPGRVAKISPLTHDIRLLEIEIDRPLKFWAGQYVDLTLSDRSITRAFSMANAPGEGGKFQLHHQEIRQWGFFVFARRRIERRRRRDREGALRHLLSARATAWSDAADRRRLRDVAAMVDLERSHRKRRAKADPIFLWRPHTG